MEVQREREKERRSLSLSLSLFSFFPFLFLHFLQLASLAAETRRKSSVYSFFVARDVDINQQLCFFASIAIAKGKSQCLSLTSGLLNFREKKLPVLVMKSAWELTVQVEVIIVVVRQGSNNNKRR